MTVYDLSVILPINADAYFYHSNDIKKSLSFSMNILEVPEVFKKMQVIRFEYDKSWYTYRIDVDSEFFYIIVWKNGDMISCMKFYNDIDVCKALHDKKENAEIYLGTYGCLDLVMTYDAIKKEMSRSIIRKNISGDDIYFLMK